MSQDLISQALIVNRTSGKLSGCAVLSRVYYIEALHIMCQEGYYRDSRETEKNKKVKPCTHKEQRGTQLLCSALSNLHLPLQSADSVRVQCLTSPLFLASYGLFLHPCIWICRRAGCYHVLHVSLPLLMPLTFVQLVCLLSCMFPF